MPRSYTLEWEILKLNITKVLILLKEWEAYCQILNDYMLNTHVRMSRVFTKKNHSDWKDTDHVADQNVIK